MAQPKLNCIVLDDDPMYCELISAFVSEHGNLTLLGGYTEPALAKEQLEKEDIHLLITDMEMPGITGIEFVKSLREPPMVIYVTSHIDYAYQSYETDAVDYISKPVSEARFNESIAKAMKRFEVKTKAEASDRLMGLVASEPDYFVIRTEAQFVKIRYQDVLFIEAMSDFIKIYTPSQVYVALSNLKNIESALPDSGFIRIHRSYIVSLKHIEAIAASSVKVNGRDLPLGESYKKAVMDKVIGNRLIKR